MLKRILTAIPLIILVLLAIFYTTPRAFAVISAIIFLYGAFEWGRLVGFSKKGQVLYFLITLILFILAGFVNALFVLTLSAIWWLVVPGILFRFQQRRPTAHWQHPYIHAAIGTLTLLACWLGFNILRLSPAGSWLVLFNLLIVWASDSGAYFIGRKWGRHLLAPGISPKKTLEGFIAALLASLLTALICGILLGFTALPLLKFTIIGLITGALCVVGDLYESMVKRIYNVKDSGAIFPGHGGLLDRIDGLLAATPFFTLGAIWLAL